MISVIRGTIHAFEHNALLTLDNPRRGLRILINGLLGPAWSINRNYLAMSCRKCSSAWRGTRVRRRRRILARQPMGATASDAPGTHSQTSHSVHKRGRAYAESIDKTQRIFSSFLQHTFIVMRVWLGLVPGVSAQSTGHAVKSAVHCSFAQAGCGIAFFRTARCTVLRAKPFRAKSP